METRLSNRQPAFVRAAAPRCSLRPWRIRGALPGLLLASPFPIHAATSNAPGEGSLLLQAEDLLARVGGDWMQSEGIGGLTWGKLVLSASLLVLMAVIAELLRWFLRRVAQRQATETPGIGGDGKSNWPWLKQVFEALIPPLMLFLWSWGLYAALAVLLARPETRASLPLRLLGWLKDAGEIAALLWFIFRMIRVVEKRLRQWTATTQSKWDDVIVVLVVKALRCVVPLIGVILVVPALDLPASTNALFHQATGLILIGTIGLILYQLVQAVEVAVLEQFRIDVKDNLEARKVYTQVKVLKKIATVVIVIFTTASMLMVFEPVRQLGTSILASAGVLGIIVGFAAQRSIATVLAGFQIAMTQPIRLDDVVIVENEWGRVEEISLTYVVVLIWDRRRLVVPISYFIEKPFQNWTRVSADLLGSVFLYLDYTVSLQALREELARLLEQSPRWDRKVQVVQVTDSKPNCMEVRVLVSAADAPTAWDLRCELREKLIDFVQRHYPDGLPRTRAELVKPEVPPNPI